MRMLRNRITQFIVAALLGGAFLTLTACNTMEGAGEDIEEAGDEIQDAAD